MRVALVNTSTKALDLHRSLRLDGPDLNVPPTSRALGHCSGFDLYLYERAAGGAVEVRSAHTLRFLHQYHPYGSSHSAGGLAASLNSYANRPMHLPVRV